MLMHSPLDRRLLALVLGAACAALGCEPAERRAAESVDSAPASLTDDEAQEALRQYIDWASSQLALGVDAAHVPAQAALQVDAFEHQLAALVGASVTSEWQADDTRYAKIGTLMSVIEPSSRYIDISDSRGYASPGPAVATAEQLVGTSRALLEAMGIDPAEASITTMPLGAQSDPGEPVERIGQKVFCLRTLGALRVAGDRMVFSYAPDGSLRAIRGQWPAVDVAGSQWSTTLSRDEAISRGLTALVQAGSAADASWPIVMETFFDPTKDEHGAWRMSLHLAVTRQGGGPDGSGGRGQLYELPL